VSTDQAMKLAAAKRRIPSAGDERAVSQNFNEIFLDQDLGPRSLYPVIDALTGQGVDVRHACRTPRRL
jgi:hypothetical protein